MDLFVLAVAVVSLSSAGSGLALLLRHQAYLSAVLLLGAGVVGTASAVLVASGRDDQAQFAGLAAAMVLGPAALLSYPRLRWRHPVDFVSIAVILGCGAVGVVYAEADVNITGVMGLIQGCAFLVHTWWRIEVSADRERRALVWMSLALVLSGLIYFFASFSAENVVSSTCLLYTSPSPRDGLLSRMPSSA